MTDREVLDRLHTALDHAAPDDLDGVLSRCQVQKGTTMNSQESNFKRKHRTAPWIAAACLALILAGGFGLHFHQAGSVASVISLDVNPSIEMKLNQKARVVSVTALNQDAAAVLEGMDLKDTDVNVAVNAIVGSLLKHGYVDELANSILVTVEDDDAARGIQLQQTLSQEIDEILSAASVHAAVLSQTVSADGTLQAKADQYGISLGKAVLIQTLVEQSDHLKFEDLTGLTVNELNLLASNPKTTLNTVVSTGSASAGAYIGAQSAQDIALRHAGVTASSVRELEVEFDYEHGRMVYEVEFKSGGTEYEYDLDASTGDIIKYKTDLDHDYRPASNSSGSQTGGDAASGTAIGAAAAKSAALKHAGLTESAVTGMRVREDWDHGTLEYEVEFRVGSMEYEYEIDGHSGKILKAEQDLEDGHDSHGKDHTQAAPANVGGGAAKEAALRHAGFTAAQVWDLSVDYEEDDGQTPHYEVDFKCGGMEYEYQIDAASGAVLSHHMEADD